MNHAGKNQGPAPRRWHAFGIQLAIWGAIIAGIYYGLLLPWFSRPLFVAEGGHYLLLLIAGVDLVLGPLLTLLAVGPRKSRPAIRQDLLTTSLLRTLALAMGLWLGWESRPAAVVWLDETFHTLPLSALKEDPTTYAAISSHLRSRPVYLIVDLPEDPAARSAVFVEAYAKGTSVLLDSSRYLPFDPRLSAIRAAHSRYISRISNHSGIASSLDKEGIQLEALDGSHWLLLPVVSRYRTHHLLIDAESGEVIRSIQLKPRLLVKYRR